MRRQILSLISTKTFKLFVILFTIVVLCLILAKSVQSDPKNVENLLKSVAIYLPGNFRPADANCYDTSYYDYFEYTTEPSFTCRLTNLIIYGKMNVITTLYIRLSTKLTYGDLLLVYGNPSREFEYPSWQTWIWKDQAPFIIANSGFKSMNEFYLPVRTLYIYE